jgi:hypothetical protein
MPRDFVPTQDAELDVWVENFVDEFLGVSETLGFTPEEGTALQNAVDDWHDAFNDSRAKLEAAKGATAIKRARRRALLGLVRPYARRIQANPLTTDTLRGDLRITLPEPRAGAGLLAVPDAAPLLRLDFGRRGRVSVHFGPNPGNESRNGLPSQAIGAVVQGAVVPQDGASAAWELLGNPSSSPMVHEVATSDGRLMQYRVAYLYRRDRRGPWSEVARAAVTP